MSSEQRRRVRAVATDDAGFSLPELLVTMTIMLVVGMAVVGSTVALQRGMGTANATMRDMAANRAAIERAGSLLRGAVSPDGRLDARLAAVEVGTPTSVTFYTVTGRVSGQTPMRVRLTVTDDGDLIEEVFPPTPDLMVQLTGSALPTYPANVNPRVIARNIRNTAVFTYWTHEEQGGDPVTRCGQRVSSSPAVAAADLQRIDSIAFHFVLQEATGYRSAASDLQGWARFASSVDLGYSANFTSAGCLDGDDSGFRYDDVYQVP